MKASELISELQDVLQDARVRLAISLLAVAFGNHLFLTYVLPYVGHHMGHYGQTVFD